MRTDSTELITSVRDLLDKIHTRHQDDLPHQHIRFWFRGEAKTRWQLRPGMYRNLLRADNEKQRLLTEQHLCQDFRIYSSGLLDGPKSSAELYFLQQHYGMPTRLLDWTTNALAALFFIVSKHKKKDGFFFWMDAYKLGETQGMKDFGIATTEDPHFKKALDVIFKWEGVEDFPDFIIPVRPDHTDYRIKHQGSCFTFHVPKHPKLTKKENDTLEKFLVPATAKRRILKELVQLGVDEFSIFGDLASLAVKLKKSYKIK